MNPVNAVLNAGRVRAWLARQASAGRVGWLLPGALVSLVLGVVVAAVVADGVVDDVREGDGFARADHPVLTFLAAHREGWLTVLMRVVTTLGSPLGVALTVAAVTGFVWWRTRRAWPWLLAGIVLGGAELLETAGKALVERPRPPVAWRAADVSAHGFSFPSGHATLAAAGYGLIAILLTHGLRDAVARAVVWAGAVGAVVAVALSRLYLGAHWLSDVAAGVVLGVGWLGLVAGAAFLLRRKRPTLRPPVLARHRL